MFDRKNIDTKYGARYTISISAAALLRVGVSVLLATTWCNGAALAQEHSSSQAQKEARLCPPPSNISLTVYNNGLGLVKDVRNLDLTDGINLMRCEDVAAKIEPASVSLHCLSAPDTVTVREQSYQYDLLNPATILSKSIGKQIKVRHFLASGGSEEISGTLLEAPDLVLKTPNAIVLNPAGQVELSELPEDLVSKPSLLWKLEASKAGKQTIGIAYRTEGLNWHCDYIFIVGKDSADLNAWVTLDNQSGVGYKNASLKLVAGNVHRVQPRIRMPRMMAMEANAGGPLQPQFTESPLADYHVYSLHNKTDINDNETKQLTLFSADKIAIKKIYVFDFDLPRFLPPDDSEFKSVKVKLEFVNSTANNLGVAMPAGKVRVYKRDDDDALQLIGEDEVAHTPKDEKVRLYTGDATDIVARRVQTNVQQTGAGEQRLTYEITLRNHTDADVTITDVEHEPAVWKVISSSMPYTKKDAHTFEFAAGVPANGETKIDYTIETRNY